MKLNVAQLITGAFHMARAQFPELNKQWIGISWKLANSLPESMLPLSVQKVGELDLVVRAMEDQFSQDQKSQAELAPFLDSYLMFFSQTWIASTYEIVRLLHDRDKGLGAGFQKLYELLTLVRVPLEKHEVASERKLTEPMLMATYQADKDTKTYVYAKDDPKRSVIMQMAISQRGSAMWLAPDIKNQTNVWVERRNISERFLAIWDA
jgi:hypothetical protein